MEAEYSLSWIFFFHIKVFPIFKSIIFITKFLMSFSIYCIISQNYKMLKLSALICNTNSAFHFTSEGISHLQEYYIYYKIFHEFFPLLCYNRKITKCSNYQPLFITLIQPFACTSYGKFTSIHFPTLIIFFFLILFHILFWK